jgi:hypothetical protein
MTRLHIQVNQTMQFYRGQQGGSAPVRLFLSGGASVMPYTAQFFAEKLNVPVEYFNPLRNIQLDPAINLEDLARVAHSLGEVVGLGLRNLAHCPVELNLMPDSTLRWQSFNQKKPYFIATVFSLVLVIAAMGFLFEKLAGVKTEVLKAVENDVGPELEKEARFKKAYSDLKKTQGEVDQVVGWMHDRYYWADVLSELRQVLIRVEQTTKNKLRTDAGVWIEQLITAAPRLEGEMTPGLEGVGLPGRRGEDENFRKKLGLERGMPGDQASADGTRSKGNTNEIATITMTFRAVSLKNVSGQADADKGIAYTVLQELQGSPLFDSDPKETRTEGDVSNDEQSGTFTFTLVARLKRPFKL